MEWHPRTVDGELLKIGASIPVQLRVEIGEEPSLQKGIFGEVDSAHDMAGLELQLLVYLQMIEPSVYVPLFAPSRRNS